MEKQQAAVELLRRTADLAPEEFSEEVFLDLADNLFRELDHSESANAQLERG